MKEQEKARGVQEKHQYKTNQIKPNKPLILAHECNNNIITTTTQRTHWFVCRNVGPHSRAFSYL